MHKSPSDKQFLEELYQQNYNLVFRVVSQRLSRYGYSRSDAADLTQEVFILAARRISMLRTYTNPKGWLCKTAQFMAMNHIHTQSQHKEQLFHSLDLQQTGDGIDAADARMSLESMLDDRDYAILNAYCIEHRPTEEICQQFNLSANSLRVHIHRLRKFLLTNFIFIVIITIRQYI